MLAGHPSFELPHPTDEPAVSTWPFNSFVIGRYLFYNESGTASPLRYDGNDAAINDRDDFAIATNKSAYLAGSGNATFANVSSYTKGINGIMIDIAGAHGQISANDFIFSVGNNNGPVVWSAAPAPSAVVTRAGAGISGSDRVVLVWGSDAVKNAWLEVRVLANETTGLAQMAGWPLGVGDAFYFGNAIGDTGAGNTQYLANVSITDELGALHNPASIFSNVPITNLYDFNRDGAVNNSDALVPRNHPTSLGNVVRFVNIANPPWIPESPLDPPDIDIDTNDDGQIDDADDEIESQYPGRIVLVDATSASNLIPVLIRAVPNYTGEPLEVLFDPNLVKVYRSSNRTLPIDPGYQASPNSTLYAEVIAVGTSSISLRRSLGGQEESDGVQFTGISVDNLEIDAPEVISADDHRMLVSLAVGDMDDEYLLSVVEGHDVTFKVYCNDSLVSTMHEDIVDGIAVATVNTSTTEGDRYKVIAAFGGREVESQEAVIEPGAPHEISYQLSKPSYVADGTDYIEIEATIRDQNGNLVADGTSVSWLVEGYGRRMVGAFPNEISTEGGKVLGVLTTPDVPGLQKIKLQSANAKATVSVEVAPLEMTLESPVALNIALNQTGVLTLRTNAADGTQVYWTLNNGTARAFVSTVFEGATSVPIQSGGGRIGACVVTASIGAKLGVWEVPFQSSAPLKITLERPVISGDVSADGATAYTYSAQPLPFSAPTRPDRTVSVPYYAQTAVQVAGTPGATYLVDYENPLVGGQYARLLGLDSANRLTLDSTGAGIFQLASSGAMSSNMLLYERVDVRLRVRPVRPQSPFEVDPTGPVAVETATYIHHDVWTRSLDVVASFFGADPTTAEGIAANIAGGMAIVGDIGSMVKNAARMAGLSDVDPNYVEFALAGAGLATEFAVGVGELADSGISSVKALVAALADVPAGKVLAYLWRRMLVNSSDSLQTVLQFGRFATRIATDGTGVAFQVLRQVFTTDEVMEAAMRVTDQFGQGFFTGIKKVSETAGLGGIAVAQLVVKSLDSIKGNAHLFLKGLSDVDVARAIEHLGAIYQAGKLDPALVEKMLSFDALFSATYTRLRFLEDLELVKGADGLESVLNQMYRSVDNFRVGHLYELQAACVILRQNGGSNVKFVVRISNEAGRTDIDFIIDGVYYQAKSGSIGSLGSVEEWVRKARFDGATVIKYVLPHGRSAVSGDILDFFADGGRNGLGEAIDVLDILIP